MLHSSQFLKESRIKKILGFTQNKEEGADAIAERYDGKIDIIQCKYLDSTDKNLTKKHKILRKSTQIEEKIKIFFDMDRISSVF